MEFWRHRSIYVLLLAAVALLTAVFLAVAAFTRRWLYVDAPARVTVNGGILRTFASDMTSYGVMQYCHATSTDEQCRPLEFHAASPELPFPWTCPRSQTELQHRFGATAAFVILAFLAAVALAILELSALAATRSQMFGFVFGSRTYLATSSKAAVTIQLSVACAVFLMALIATAIFGGTIGTWANCGHHYCAAMTGIIQQRQRLPRSLAVEYEYLVDCGFGYSYALCVCGSVFAFALVLLHTADLFTLRNLQLRAPGPEPFDLPKGFSPIRDPYHDDYQYTSSRSSTKEPLKQDMFVADDEVVTFIARGLTGAALPPRLDTVVHDRGEDDEEGGDASSPASSDASVVEVVDVQRGTHDDFVTPAVARAAARESTPEMIMVEDVSSVAEPPRRLLLLPDGDDWEYDAEEDLHWSASQQLFFDQRSGHFYDPASTAWFNPVLQRWYRL
jgi:hypothetical protein